MHLHCFPPVDKHAQANVLDDHAYKNLLHAVSSKSVSAIWFHVPAEPWLPPAHHSKASRAIRSTAHPQGLPDLSTESSARLLSSEACMERCFRLATACHSAGGTFCFQAHPASTWWLHPATCHLLQATGAHVTATAFCSHGLDRQGAWLLACNTARCHSLASLCQHDPGQHPVVMLKRKREPQTSQPQPTYTDSFLQAAARCLQPLLPARTSPMQPWTQEPPAPTTLPAISRPAICDGAGLHSSADHSNATCQPALQQLRTAWLSWACSIDLPKRVACHLMQSKPEHPLSEAECAKAAELAHECLHPLTALIPHASPLHRVSPSACSCCKHCLPPPQTQTPTSSPS